MYTKSYLNNTLTINKTKGRMSRSYLYELNVWIISLKGHKQEYTIVKTERESVDLLRTDWSKHTTT